MGQYSKLLACITLAMMLSLGGCGGQQRISSQQSASAPNTSAKAASVIPSAQRLVARDAGIALSAGGYTLSWEYENPGDYGQDSMVGLEDVAPLSAYFNEAASPANEWIDGSGNGKLGIEDVTPIAMNWRSEVTGYRIDGAESTEGPWSEVASLTLDDGDGTNGRLAFTNEIAPGYTYYRIVTLTPDGDAASSEALVAPSNEPIIYDVTPLSGYQHEEYTFTATASGQAPLTYAWDFGGGASPNTSSDISPTVTFSDAGEYAASLTISNSYGPATFPFTLTVLARDMWAHTWSVEGRDSVSSIAVDEEGNIWAVGSRLLKFSPSGELLLARSLGGSDIAMTGNGELWVVYHTDEYGAGALDVLLLKYDLQGNLLLAKTCGASWLDVPVAMAIDQQGNLYVTGTTVSEPFSDNNLMLLKFSPEGSLLFAVAVDAGGNEQGRDIAITNSGEVFVVGVPLLLTFTAVGSLEWAKASSAETQVWFNAIRQGHDGNLYGAGTIRIQEDSSRDFLLSKLDTGGNILSSLAWGTQEDEGAITMTIDSRGNLILAGIVTYEDSYHDGILLKYNSRGSLLDELKWVGSDKSSPVIYGVTTDNSDNVFLGGSAEQAGGEWILMDGTTSAPALELSECAVQMSELTYTETELTNLDSLPAEGLLDSEFQVVTPYQALILKNFGE